MCLINNELEHNYSSSKDSEVQDSESKSRDPAYGGLCTNLWVSGRKFIDQQ